MPSGRITLLDDDAAAVRVLSLALKDYDLVTYRNVEGFLSGLDQEADCYLLDINMPDACGYDICRVLHSREQSRHTPVIFISGQTGIHDRLQGYAAGGDDFIGKPFDVDELRAKVDRALRQVERQKAWQVSADDARMAAFEPMTHSAEQGEVCRFIEQSIACNVPEEVAEQLVATLKSFGLNAVVAVWEQGGGFFSHAAEVRPLEAELMRSCRCVGRIVEMERRLQVNYQGVSVLIKNTPFDDSGRYGRLKDHLCVLMSGANARLASLASEQRYTQQQTLLEALDEVQQSLESLQHTQQRQLDMARDAAAELRMLFVEELMLLNLDADQESQLTQLITSHLTELGHMYHRSADLKGLLEPVLSVLRHMAGVRDAQEDFISA